MSASEGSGISSDCAARALLGAFLRPPVVDFFLAAVFFAPDFPAREAFFGAAAAVSVGGTGGFVSPAGTSPLAESFLVFLGTVLIDL